MRASLPGWRIAGRLLGRARAWELERDPRLVVRHCGHPTALRPYWVIVDGASLLDMLGTFRLLREAQAAGERHLIVEGVA